jgi:hypothetical protein
MTDLYTPLHCDLFVLDSLFYADEDDRLELQRTFGMVIFPRETPTRGAALLKESLFACYSPSPSACL